VPILFGTYNSSTATSAEVELSQSVQTAFANFAKDPETSPAPNWPAYEPGFVGVATVPTLAEIAYQGNVSFDGFIQPVQPISKVSTGNLFFEAYFFIIERRGFIEGRAVPRLGRADRFPPLRNPQLLGRIILLEWLRYSLNVV
jgi:hypothetical protein